jgi:hypothetical protein
MGNNIKSSLCKCLDTPVYNEMELPPGLEKEEADEYYSQKYNLLSEPQVIHEEEHSAFKSFEPRDSLLTANDLRLSKTEDEITSNTLVVTNPIQDSAFISSIIPCPDIIKSLSSKSHNQRNMEPLEIIKENTAGSQFCNSEFENASSNTHLSRIKVNKSMAIEKELNKDKNNSCHGKNYYSQRLNKASNDFISKGGFNFSIIHNLLKKCSDPLIHAEFYKLVIDEKAKNILVKNAFSYSKKFCVFNKNEFSYYNTKENYLRSYPPKLVIDIEKIDQVDKMSDKFFNDTFVKKFQIKNTTSNLVFHFYIKLKCESDNIENAFIFASEKPENVEIWVNLIKYLKNILNS